MWSSYILPTASAAANTILSSIRSSSRILAYKSAMLQRTFLMGQKGSSWKLLWRDGLNTTLRNCPGRSGEECMILPQSARQRDPLRHLAIRSILMGIMRSMRRQHRMCCIPLRCMRMVAASPTSSSIWICMGSAPGRAILSAARL